MHKKSLGLSSVIMAGMLAVSSVSPAAVTAYATETGDATVIAAQEDVAKEQKSEETSEKKAEEVVSEEKTEDVKTEAEAEKEETEKKETTAEEKKTEETTEKEEPKEETASEEVKEKAKEEVKEEVKEAEETAEAKEEGLTFFNRWNQSETVKGKLEFSSQYQEFCYDLGETIDAANCKGVHVKVSEQGNNICIKLYDADMNEKLASYSNSGKDEYTVVPNYDGTVRYIGIMSMPSETEAYPYSVTVDEVKADVEEAAPVQNEETLVYKADDIKLSHRWSGEETTPEINFSAEWEEYWFSLGKTVNAEAIKSVKVTFKENTPNLAFKLYDAEGTELQAFYGQSGKSEYVIFPSTTGDVTNFAIMAMNEQTFPATATLESVEIVVDTTPQEEQVEKGVERDIVDLRDPMTAILGDDFIIGTAISYMEFADEMEMELVTKHFNGVTLGNELKPDSMLKKNAEIIKYNLNGEEIEVPELNYETPERYLDFFVNWNNEHPDKKIRVRGHVLVWHSQTPEFFFHEDYDTNKPYVTPEVMNKRLEYYIKSVATHFTADDSKYKDLFYGWDVVNEAVSDGTGTYRNASENSSWWAVYQSPEFIQNAFVYANKYMPADIALFYNDYNEYVTSKVGGICELLRTVKETPGARIDGMGMQAHYQVDANSPTMEQFKSAATAYSKIVDQVQVTELDYKGSANSKDERLANRYKALYDTIRRLKNDGVNITGMTIWGVVDKHSWLQTANNNGGGSNGNARQYPLLFDDNYKAKNAFWALANAGDLEPEIKNLILVQNINDDFSVGNSYSFKDGDKSASFVPLWGEDGIAVKVTVADSAVEDTDCFTIYADDTKGINSVTVKRSEATEVEGGYEAVVKLAVDSDALTANTVKMDVTVTDGEKTYAFGDTTLKQSESSKYFAETVIKPLLSVKKGTIEVDGETTDEAWANAKEVPLTINIGSSVSANAKVLWDEENLYVVAEVKDAVLNKDSSQAHEQDSLEVFIDENNNKTTAYEEDDKQYRVNFDNEQSFNGKKCTAENVKSATKKTEDGYIVEAAFKWTDITPEAGKKVGLELQINDADASGKRAGTLSWADKSGTGWSSTEVFGTILLADGETAPVDPENPEDPENPGNPEDPAPVDPTPEEPTPEDPTPTEPQDPVTPEDPENPEDPSNPEQPEKPEPTDPEPVEPEKPEEVIPRIVYRGLTAYCVDQHGNILTGIQKINGKEYFFSPDGIMYRGTFAYEGGKKYFVKLDGTIAKNELAITLGKIVILDKNGQERTGFVDYKGKTYYCRPNEGAYWLTFFNVKGKTYFAHLDGTLAKNESFWILWHKFTFDKNGVLKNR